MQRCIDNAKIVPPSSPNPVNSATSKEIVLSLLASTYLCLYFANVMELGSCFPLLSSSTVAVDMLMFAISVVTAISAFAWSVATHGYYASLYIF